MEFPEFSLRTISGETRKYSDLKGEKLTVVVFWSTWSANSEKCLTRMQKLYQQYGEKGLAVVAIDADEQQIAGPTLTAVKEKVAALRLTFPVLIDNGLAAFHDAGVIALPTTVVLDKERVIRYELSGYPLAGAEELADFVVLTMEGKKTTAVAEQKGRRPDKNALRFYNMGKNTLKSRRMADSAETWFKKSIEADPRFVLPRLSLGKFYLQKGNIAAASEQFEQALAVEPDNVIALCEMGMILAGEGKTAEGEALFARTLKADESYTPCFYYSGYVLGKKGDVAKAQEKFSAATAINPADHNILVYKARMYEDNRMLKPAAESYRKALEILLGLK
ncbi:MAG TPA: redoxin domain-containing protein [Geobacteraceae bacterium]|nr:redoxin domain-containing protein [Geobacteraceae bacterium]